MRLIEKNILVLLGISLIPMFAAGWLIFSAVQHSIEQQTLENLSSTATIEEHRIAAIQEQNTERLTYFTSRLQLKQLIDQYNHTHTARDQSQIAANLEETKKATSNINDITIVDTSGRVIASTNRQLNGQDYSANELFLMGRKEDASKLVTQGMGQDPVFHLSGPLLLNGQSIGVVGITTKASELLATVRDYTGLGSTGEINLIEKYNNSRATYITPLRFDSRAAFNRTTSVDSPITKAALGQDTTITDAQDYRGKPVLVATRYLKNSHWGLIVKIDRTEAFLPSAQLKSEFLLLAFISSVLVVFTAIVLAQRSVQPILDIDEVAEKVSRGQLLDRVENISHDEIGNLAGTFNVMLDNLEELDKAKSDFVSLASHQLRTPATGVKAIIGLLLKNHSKDLTPQLKNYLEQAFDSNERQLRVINDLLNVAMLESGKLKLKTAPMDLRDLVKSTVTEQRMTVKSRKQTIAVDVPSRPLVAAIDAEKLRMVLDNLVSNASKYTQDGGTVTIALRKNKSDVTIAVTDTGVGISEKDIKKLFQKFSQLDNHLNHAGGGSAGLGLYLAKKIVELHGGKITVTSQLGKGTTFTVELPVRPA